MMAVNEVKKKNITITLEDLLYFFIFTLLFLCISQDGILKYIILSLAAVVFILLGARLKKSYFIIILHVFVYVLIGLLFSIVNKNITFQGLKQILIYLSSGIFSIVFFSYFGTKNTEKLINYQFFGLIFAYILLYARYFTIDNFYYESCLYAYIFGVYALIYLYQKSYVNMVVAIIFMLLDHKRIVNAAFVIALFCMFLVIACRSYKSKKFLYKLGLVLIFIAPIMWVFLCSNGMLATIFAKLNINTMGRLEGTGAWNIAQQYYKFSPLYFGKGVGWVLNWLENADIFAFSNLHNDFLVAFIELGFLGFIIWDISFLLILRYVRKKSIEKANLILVLIGFMFINLLTDNIYLYVTFLTPFYLVVLSVIFGENKGDNCVATQKNSLGALTNDKGIANG